MRVDDQFIRCENCGRQIGFGGDPRQLTGQFFCGVADADRRTAVQQWAAAHRRPEKKRRRVKPADADPKKFPCPHRGDQIEVRQGDLCGDRDKSVPVYACALHGQCSILRQCRKLRSCASCEDRPGVQEALEDRATEPQRSEVRNSQSAIRNPQSVSVVITCHNYGRFLPRAIDSVLRQLRPADRIIVVDDASQDGTFAIAAGFADRGVAYLRGEWRNTHRARAAGVAATDSTFVAFLDGDDEYHPNFLADCLRAFEQAPRNVGVVYCDLVEVYPGGSMRPRPMRETASVWIENYLCCASLCRRSALDSSGVMQETIPQSAHEDAAMWRAVLAAGWKAQWCPGVYYYHRHGQSESEKRHAAGEINGRYYQLWNLRAEPVTIFTPLSGRAVDWWRYAQWLGFQTWPHERIRLVLCDTSNDPQFSRMVKNGLRGCDYSDVRYYRQDLGAAGVADLPRIAEGGPTEACREVQRRMPLIYNRFARELGTEFALVLEDDVLPPLDAIEQLMRSWGWGGKDASVSAAVYGRFQGHWIAWDDQRRPLRKPGRGTVRVGGNGFGCVLLHRFMLERAVFRADHVSLDFDHNFYRDLAEAGFAAKLNWNVVCQHAGEWPPGYQEAGDRDQGAETVPVLTPGP